MVGGFMILHNEHDDAMSVGFFWNGTERKDRRILMYAFLSLVCISISLCILYTIQMESVAFWRCRFVPPHSSFLASLP